MASHRGEETEFQKTLNCETSPIPKERRGGFKAFWLASDILEFTSHGYDGHMFDDEGNKREFPKGRFRADGLSSSYRTPGNIPMTAYRYNVIGDKVTCSIVEGETAELPAEVADYVNNVTDKTWPETYWVPRGMTSFEYMSKIGPNHDGNSYGLIGADLITLNAMLRIPVDLHNIDEKDIFRPTIWDRFGGDDFIACEELGGLYM